MTTKVNVINKDGHDCSKSRRLSMDQAKLYWIKYGFTRRQLRLTWRAGAILGRKLLATASARQLF